MLANYHMHTNYSEDSCFQMEDVVCEAIYCGFNDICITDHLDMIKDFNPCFPYRAYEKELKFLKEKYADEISLKLGMEFGVQPCTVPFFQKFFDEGDFDFILLSCHIVDNKWLYCQDFQDGKSRDEYNLRYYEQLLELVNMYSDYSVLAHLDVIRRYDLQGAYPFEKIKPIVTEILKKVIKDGKGIELNTSCYRYNLGDLTPSRDILKLYHDLGGKILTIGTDSHRPEHVDMNFYDGVNELKSLGFEQYCTFDKMTPKFHNLSEINYPSVV